MRDFMSVTKALSDENRVRILMALTVGELCVCQIIELLELAPSTVSKHMLILKHARLVDARKNGKWVYYRLAGDNAPGAVRGAIDWAREQLANDNAFKRDAKQLKDILRRKPVEVCEKQRASRIVRSAGLSAQTAPTT